MAITQKGFIFKRVEVKYMLTDEQYEGLFKMIGDKIQIDEYGLSTICNLYFDNTNDELIKTSLDKPKYKEKVRLRSYGVPKSLNSKVFLEIKKKYQGIVYKRRVSLTLREVKDYIENDVKPKDSQILRELDYTINHYRIFPKIFIAYDREAYYAKDDTEFRMTFDKNIRYRRSDVKLEAGDQGTQLIDHSYHLLEVKAGGAYPEWLIKAFSELKIYPTSFSKYGAIYKKEMLERLEAASAISSVTGYNPNTVYGNVAGSVQSV